MNQQDIVFRFGGSVWVMNPNGKNRRQLTNSANSFPFWLPGGRRVVFYSSQNGQKQGYVMNSDGTDEMARFAPGSEKFATARNAVGITHYILACRICHRMENRLYFET